MAELEKRGFFVEFTIGKGTVDETGALRAEERIKLPLAYSFDDPIESVLEALSGLMERVPYLMEGKEFDAKGFREFVSSIGPRPDRRWYGVLERGKTPRPGRGRRKYDKIGRCPKCGTPLYVGDEGYCHHCQSIFDVGRPGTAGTRIAPRPGRAL